MTLTNLPQNVKITLEQVKHPAIDNSLINLGIIKEVSVIKDVVDVIFAFPFPNIPIADKLVNSISKPIKELGFNFNHTIVVMDESEKAKFMELEQQGWTGL